MAFLRHGCAVPAICPAGHPLALVPGIGTLYPYRGVRSLQSLHRAILAAKPDLIVPCNDGVVLQLHALHTQQPSLRALIERSLGDPASFPVVESRERLLALAAELGIRTPGTRPVGSGADISNCPRAFAVLKSDGSTGGNGVAITWDNDEKEAAYNRLSQPLSLATALKRLLVNRDPLSIWRWKAQNRPAIAAQEFVLGSPANTMIACWQGEVLASVTVEVLASQGATGAATVVRFLQHDEIEQASRKLANQLKLSGFFGLDFILEAAPKNAAPHAFLIELNPRCTQLGHLVRPHQADLAGVLAVRATDKRIEDVPILHPIENQVVAFFPQAQAWNPQNPYLTHGFHDVPLEAPALVAELKLEEWPYRQLPARLYHHFFPPRSNAESQTLNRNYPFEATRPAPHE